MSQLIWLDDSLEFPDTRSALDDPEGLLAVGGDLSVPRLLAAYRLGIFPWYSEGQPILWWSPSPRTVLIPGDIHIGRSNRKLLKKSPLHITVDTAFDAVVAHCAQAPRKDQDGTWITSDIMHAYGELHHAGHAHSVEAWHADRLVGGLYGVSLGAMFFGESMFSVESGASKVAFMRLTQALHKWGYQMIDCQMHTEHLAAFGAHDVPRATFESRLAKAVSSKGKHNWRAAWPAFTEGST